MHITGESGQESAKEAPSLEGLDEKALLDLHTDLSLKLKDYGYASSLSGTPRQAGRAG